MAKKLIFFLDMWGILLFYRIMDNNGRRNDFRTTGINL